MKKVMLRKSDTKKGAASIYIVVFATILFGVITTSFAKIIISEADQSSKDDLSRSAYDAALAGVEDAKYYINKYYECMTKAGSNVAACEASYNIMTDPDSIEYSCENGFPLLEKKHVVNDHEVKIQQSTMSGNSGEEMDQAYTCVLVTDKTPDYRGTLTSDTRTRVIPISMAGVTGGGGLGAAAGAGKEIGSVKVSWYSQLNQGAMIKKFNMSSGTQLPTASNAPVPPAMQIQVVKAPAGINVNELHKVSNSGEYVNSTMVFMPSATGKTNLDWGTIVTAGNVAENLQNSPFDVKCTQGEEFACNMSLGMGGFKSGTVNIFLVLSLPYGDAFTDFAVTLYDKAGQPMELQGVQVSVDSTGRTNQLYRRVESRLEVADLFFPYPQYELDLGTNTDTTKKFWVTANCWTETDKCPNNGNISD